MPHRTAMILAAGRGERLRPLTDHLPKPLMRIGPHTLIERHLIQLKKSGFERVVINTAWLGHLIEQQLGDGQRYGLQIRYSREGQQALETAGGIQQALGLIEEHRFVVINGDICTDFDFSQLPEAPEAGAHLLLVENPSHHPEGDFGIVDGKLSLQRTNRLTFSGIASYHRSFFRLTPGEKAALGPLFIKGAKNKKITAEQALMRWMDVGTENRLQLTRKIFAI